MKFATVLVLGVALISCSAVPVKKTKFECPPPDQIYPCTCSANPRKIVKCDDVKNLDIIRRALEHRFPNPLPKLVISNVHTFQLPHHAFRNISATRLVLNGSNIRKIHDDAFDGQDNLGLLILSEDRITEFPTEALKRLPHLVSLSLAGNFIMKIADYSLEDNTRLKGLILADNRISTIERNAFPRTLDSLTLSRNHLTTLNGTLHNLDKLEWFFAGNNRLSTVKGELKGLTHLRYLSLEENSIFDIDHSFDDLLNLRHLNLAYNNLENVDGLHPLKKLIHLNLSYNYIIDIDDDIFKNVNDIEVLDLSGNFLKDACRSLKPLKKLEKLILSNTNLNVIDYDCFKGMRNLQLLDLSQNELINIDGVTGHSFPKLWFLHLQDNHLQMFRHGLKNLRNLLELDISDNEFSSIKGHHLMHNTQLRKLKIDGNSWDCTDHLLQVFRDLEAKRVKLLGAPMCYLDRNAL
ncbi:hypothetical protein TNCT_430321 [Trichonephila clavata]|uniref:Uncharacterized protein n=1 Tax=Trichonephila clavata TaxID=2740835 RepID=A0A8X6K9T1_TRICU|nr:hypothetical protein TNCT_430321 [Trichonephila clavata]